MTLGQAGNSQALAEVGKSGVCKQDAHTILSPDQGREKVTEVVDEVA
jgi:hypothetical protein